MRYAAFISYSHTPDTHRARLLRQALHTFARPWNRMRALRVFLDNAAMSMEHNLWSTVEQALGDSEYLLLLASPESRASKWVGKEIDWWRQGPRAEKLLLVVTGGEIHWDEAAGDFDFVRSTCLHPSLRGHFTAEPRWVDLRWMDADHSGDLREPRFREAVADLAAPLHDRPKDELFGEDVTQRGRLRRFRQGMLAGMTALAVLATAAAVFAFAQRNTAQQQARIATARQLAATALNLSGDDLETASLLALQAYQVEETPETLSALYQVTTQSPHLVRFVHAGATVTALAHTTSPRFVAAGTDKGTVTLWTADGSRRAERFSLTGQINALAFSDDDQLLAIGTSSGEVVLHDLQTGKNQRLSGKGSAVSLISFRPSTHDLAWMDGDNSLKLHEGRTEKVSHHIETELLSAALNLAFWDNGNKITVTSAMGWRIYDGKLRTLDASDDVQFPANGYVSAASPSGKCFGFMKFGSVSLSSLEQLSQGSSPGSDTEGSGCGAQTTRVGKETSSLAVSDGRRTAVGTSQGLLLATAEEGSPQAVLETLPGVEAPSLLAFSPGEGDRPASADGSTVALWSLTERAPTMHRHSVSVPDGATVEYQPPLALSPGGLLAWSQQTTVESPLSLHVRSPEGEIASAADMPYASLTFGNSEDVLYAASSSSLEMWRYKSGSLTREKSFALPEHLGASGKTQISSRPDGRVVVTLADDSVLLVDPGTGKQSIAVKGAAEGSTGEDSQPTGSTESVTAISEKGDLAAVSTGDGYVSVYRVASGELLQRLDLGTSAVNSLTLSEERQSLLAVTDGRVLQNWSLQSGQLRWRSQGAGVNGLVTDHTGQWTATLAGDGTVWLWDFATGDRLGNVTVPWTDISFSGTGGPGWQTSLIFSADGKNLWSATEGGEIMSWDVSVDAWTKQLCARAGRRLTETERDRYLTSISEGHTACGEHEGAAHGAP
ncbi:WD40 repeat protein [Streptomyces sp. SAI-195]|uniref:toll/interleukin-1 receptor domain-containing protein n=1 Tax=unclassified Streptomyces TaxID=2593676 RepID=UPI003C7C4C3F